MTGERRKKLESYYEMLYLIDMINGFVKKGNLHDKHILQTVPEQKKLLDYVNDLNQGIGFVRDEHEENSLELKTFLPHAIKGSGEELVIDELKPYTIGAMDYPKNSTNALFAPGVIEDIKIMSNLKLVVVVGCCTDICVLNYVMGLRNYFNQIDRDIKIVVVRKATDTYDIPGVHDREHFEEMAYELMAQAGIIVVDDFNELLKRKEEMGLVLRKEMR